ncbi:uncharacterized protein LOC133806773 [Humulus lupulus]|uniref:uncharacterized protein LOC133806773 n=1 Tax=Humulus lupulus TaxID=3486 RepID=UPI002B417834|nr:uncharacterized protein LOC133806773 [Humulus lupulus]
MDCFKEGGSTTRPPMLDGTNYACWKARMRAFLKAMDEHVWSAVVDGWTPPTIKDVFVSQMKAIENCEIAKDAWDKLQTINEGTKNVKKSRLRSLTTEFENLTMRDDESITEFHARLCDITNEYFSLGETYSDSKLNYELTMKMWSKEKKEKRVSSGVALPHKVAENLFVGDSLENLDEEKAECANTLKKKGRALAATWSDSEEDQKATEEDSSDLEENFVAFIVNTSKTPCSDTDSDGVCSDEDDLDQQTAYEQMYNQWVSVIKKAKILEIKVGELEEERRNLLGKVDFLTLDIEEKRVALEEMQEKLDYANKTIETYTVGQDLFDNMMGICQFAREKHGVGFNQPLAIKKKDLPSSSKKMSPISPSFLATPKNSPATAKFIPICHLCGKKGHIRPRCYKLNFYLSHLINISKDKAQVSLVGRKQWRPKNAHTKALVVHTSLLACNSDQWYFDSGCSRHMTGNKHLLTNLLSYVEGYVTFGDGSKGRIMGRGKLHLHGLPPLENVLYVEGIRSNDNFYLLCTNLVCNVAKTDETELWHYKLGHLNYRDLGKLVKLKAVRSVPNLAPLKEKVCGPCQLSKQVKSSHPPLKFLVTSKALELLHVDLMGLMQTESLSGKRYVMMCVDDYTRFSWVRFLREKSDSFENFKGLYLSLQAEKGEKVKKVIHLRSDHGKEFENNIFADFCNQEGIAHEFSAPKTPQQNGVVERKKQTLQEMARVMLNAKKLSKRLWVETVNTTCYISNRVHLRPDTKQTSYELWKGRTPNLAYLHVFGCKSSFSMIEKSLAVMESINVVFSDLEDFASYSEEEEIHTLVDTSILPVASRTANEPSGSKIEEIDATTKTSEAFDVSSIPENIASSDLKIH